MDACSQHKEQGAIIGLVAVALMALIGMAVVTVDVGRLVFAAQVAQDVADAGALGAGLELPDSGLAQSVALEV